MSGSSVVSMSAIGAVLLGAFTAYSGYQTGNPALVYTGVGQIVAALSAMAGHNSAIAAAAPSK